MTITLGYNQQEEGGNYRLWCKIPVEDGWRELAVASSKEAAVESISAFGDLLETLGITVFYENDVGLELLESRG